MTEDKKIYIIYTMDDSFSRKPALHESIQVKEVEIPGISF